MNPASDKKDESLSSHPLLLSFTEVNTSDGIRRLFWFSAQRSYGIRARSKNSAVDITIKTSEKSFTNQSYVQSPTISDQERRKQVVNPLRSNLTLH